MSKGLLSNDTVVQGDFCPMGLLSKEAFTNEKLAQIIFFCPALTKLALDLHVNFCVSVCLSVCLSVFPVFFSRRLIG